jgi:hypothetical protein
MLCPAPPARSFGAPSISAVPPVPISRDRGPPFSGQVAPLRRAAGLRRSTGAGAFAYSPALGRPDLRSDELDTGGRRTLPLSIVSSGCFALLERTLPRGHGMENWVRLASGKPAPSRCRRPALKHVSRTFKNRRSRTEVGRFFDPGRPGPGMNVAKKIILIYCDL